MYTIKNETEYQMQINGYSIGKRTLQYVIPSKGKVEIMKSSYSDPFLLRGDEDSIVISIPNHKPIIQSCDKDLVMFCDSIKKNLMRREDAEYVYNRKGKAINGGIVDSFYTFTFKEIDFHKE